jgi:hypothetical protein
MGFLRVGFCQTKRLGWGVVNGFLRVSGEIVTDGVFSAGDDGAAIFHPAVDLDKDDYLAVHTLDTPDHAGG